MRKSLPVRNRWFTAVAVTCLSGFALCGCARGTRDVATSLKDNAAREAVEAERKIAERKRGESRALSSKESFASKEKPALPSKGDKGLAASSKNPFDRPDSAKGSSNLAKSSAKKPSKSTSPTSKGDLATAEWSGDSLDRRVKTVSGEKESEDVDVAEPLLDSRGREDVASDLFDENGAEVSAKKKTDLKGKTAAKTPFGSDSKLDLSEKKESLTAKKTEVKKSDTVSFEDHPWAKESPAEEKTAARAKTKDIRNVSKTPMAEISPDDLKEDSLEEESSTAFQKTGSLKKDPIKSDQTSLDEAQQLEAKARVQSLLTQSKTFVNKGELRSAYRVAQQAQRIADSEDLYFTAGEEQPADVVRAVLMKIRFEENKHAAHKPASGSEAGVEPQGKSAKTQKQVSLTKKEFANVPDGWSNATTSKDEDPSVYETPEKSGGSNNPWAKSDFVAATPHPMEIKPRPTAQTVRSIPAFPDTQDQWRGVANEPMSLGGKSSGIQASGFESSAQNAFQKSKVTHAALPAAPGSGSTQEAPVGPLTVSTDPPTAPAEQVATVAVAPQTQKAMESREVSEPIDQPVPGSLASADDWRNQDLADIGVTRTPLLVAKDVAPAPPVEPTAAKNLAADVMDDSLGIDVQEPVPAKESSSKLWMILAAAAGACAMLFIRQRPARVVRTTGPAK
ncbi:MAG: hypothetical protein U0929_10815 [Planctomycetaceae bacterium]